MAKKVKTWLTDDVEAAAGKDVEADQTVIFGLDGKNYEIDLSAKNATKLRTEMEQWVPHARPIGSMTNRKRTTDTARSRSSSSNDQLAGMDAEQKRAMREWARNNGWPNLKDRGRLPVDAIEAFHNRPSVVA